MSQITLLPEDIILHNLILYLNFDSCVDFLTCCKNFKKKYMYLLLKFKLNKKDSLSFIVNYSYKNYILNKIYEKNTFKYLCLNLSNIKISKKKFHNLCNLNTLKVGLSYNKYYSIDDLLKLYNIKTLIISCINEYFYMKDIIKNLAYLHNERKISTIIIEEFTENYIYDEKHILICEKDCIKMYYAKSYNDINKSQYPIMISVEKYLNNGDFYLNEINNYQYDEFDDVLEDIFHDEFHDEFDDYPSDNDSLYYESSADTEVTEEKIERMKYDDMMFAKSFHLY